ncbi:MAG: Asp23/Gls24 family envelope stress response protein [Candidatus Omnitrophica bacterium]|nr:Asp23/Gls24 family envelope stress response protein [Candidatus Omnitrophota bacterium]
MQSDESRTDIGLIRIHDKVISSISSLAATEIEGVKGIRRGYRTGFISILDKKGISAIKVIKDKNGEITVQIPLIIKYGYNIPEVAARVQENVRNNLEKMAGLIVKDINISVQGIEKD